MQSALPVPQEKPEIWIFKQTFPGVSMLATNSNSVNARLREREEWGLNRRNSKHFGMHFQIFKTPQQAKQNTQSGYIQLCEPAFVIFDFYKHRTGNPKDGPIITISFSLLLETCSVRLG